MKTAIFSMRLLLHEITYFYTKFSRGASITFSPIVVAAFLLTPLAILSLASFAALRTICRLVFSTFLLIVLSSLSIVSLVLEE
ncbi:hypothetical protein BD560DRAFT_406615 [Blakeslea trispora]|nr:hypothetical protein BD560DRAFT_406615 [Blakeslea trispora]